MTRELEAFLWRRALEGNESAIRRLLRMMHNEMIQLGLDPR